MVARAKFTTSLIYNVPANLFHRYRGRNVIVRSSSSAELVECLSDADLTDVRFIELSSTREDTSCLKQLGPGIPLDIVLADPAHLEELYRYTKLLDTHPIRITIPAVPGFSKAVNLAIALQYAVKLEVPQPDKQLLNEIESVLDLYLHRRAVNQPIEPFHSLLLSLYRDEPTSLWEITEEDPALVRYIGDDGCETASRTDFVEFMAAQLIGERRECHDCEFFDRCRGYFKWPDENYSCDGIKRVFRTLESAATEVKQDLESYQSLEVAAQT